MKILYLVTDPGIPLYGRKGCSTHVRETVLTLQKLGHEVKVVCSNTEGDDYEATHMDVERVEPLRSRKLGFDLRHLLLDRRVRRHLDALVRQWQPDALYERYSLYCRAGEQVASRYRLPRLLEVNAFLTREQTGRIRLGPLARWIERRVIGRARNVIVVSQPLVSEVERLGVPRDGIAKMPMAVDLDKFHPSIDGSAVRRQYGLEGRFVIGYVGTLAGWHGIRLLYDMAQAMRRRQAPPFAFLVVGGDLEKIEMHRRKTREAGLEGIMHFIGSVVHDAVPTHIRAMDAAIVPDMTYWSSPAKLFEYQASGVAALAPDYPSIHDAMRHGQEGLIYPAGDIEAMADAALTLMNDPARRQAMGEASRRRAEAEHSWIHNGESILALFEKIRNEMAAS